jgi:MraZ protein
VEFVGEHVHTLDAKGRLIFPVRMRDQLGPQVTLQKGIERCVYVYPPDEWERRVRDVNEKLPMTDPNARRFARFFFSQASREQVDRQGRLTIPPAFREYAGLEREVVVVGNGPRAEIWDRAAWEQHRAEAEASIEEIAAKLGI